MADVRVVAGKVSAGRIEAVKVAISGLPDRVLDRAAVIAWMKDGHSFVPVVGGARGTALQLVEVADDWFVRSDNAPESSDRLPELPGL